MGKGRDGDGDGDGDGLFIDIGVFVEHFRCSK